MLKLNWKVALSSALVFTFIGLPALGQETGNKSLQKFDLLGYTSEIMMTGKPSTDVKLAEEVEESEGELSELHSGVQKMSHEVEVELSSEHQSFSGESEGDGELVRLLKKIFGAAMDF